MKKNKEPISEYNARMRKLISSIGVHEETIFDYNPTDAELGRWGGRITFDKCFEYKIYVTFTSRDNRLYMLGLLFSMRGDYEKGNEYFSQIEDRDMLHTLVEDF